MALLTVQGLTLAYDKKIIAENLDFVVQAGDYLVIVGENGSGKTTLMKTLLKLKMPAGGKILTGDGLMPYEIGYLPQQTDVQKDFPASVREIVLSGCQGRCGWRPFYRKEEKKKAEDNMERMGILSLADRPYKELSGGQQQRVLLARALGSADKLLLMDEPVSGLDPAGTEEMYELIASLNRDGMAVIMISHDIETVFHYASHVLQMGMDFFFGTKEAYKRSEVGQFYLSRRKGGKKHAK